MCQTLLSTKYLLLHLILPTTLWSRYHGYINPILQMMKLKFIKVRKLAPTPTVGKQQGWDVNPGLAGAKWPCFLHCRRLHLSPSRVSFISGNALWSAAHSPAWSWLPFGHPPAMLSPVMTAKELHHKCCLFSFFILWTPIRTDRKTPVFCF